ncbi:MAG: ATP-binding protein [Planctomycetota bacterium]|nr:ATP-binding protein [Planctomycetota bacterium]
MMVIDRDYRIVLANRAAQKMAGGKDPVSAHLTCYQVTHHRDTPCEGEMELCPAKKVFETRTPVTVTHTHYNADGNEHVVEISAAPIINEMGEVIQVVESFRDVTERKRIESQLRQSVKMEAIGRLAGGIAHDFNNMLAIIQGYADLMLKSMDQDSRHYEDVQSIRAAAKRAATLTRQLLAFGRKQTIQPRVIDLNEIITDTDSMLRRIIGEDIELITILGENPWCVKVDPIQVAEQVIINLAANAREAMPDGGKLTIETSNVTLDADYARRHAEVTPGDYVMLTVSDTGVGMTEEIKSHIFEPFFTTRETGKGTGLGLSTVYGVVKQSGGYIWVYSEPGKGTTFKIYLPRVVTPVERMKHEYEPENVPRGNETIMVAEDESSVRKMTCRMLRDQGYIVLEASDGKEAIRAAEGFTGGEIHMLITDVIMPHMSGKDLVGRVKTIHPNIKVLFVSGYTDNAIVHHGVLDEGVNFLVKPFSTRQLARTVHRLLNAK